MSLTDARRASPAPKFDAAEIGAIAHLYRGEVYRSTIWRTRLDNTTNWSVATLGIALSVTFSNKEASPLPLVLVGVLVAIFLLFEARRYRYFNVWRARCRWLETNFYAPMLKGEAVTSGSSWQETLANDYCAPHHHISLATAVGRRLRRTYAWILGVQTLAYYGKVAIHPTPLQSLDELWARAAVGPIPGQAMIAAGFAFNLAWIAFALWTWEQDRKRHGKRPQAAMG
jgi:uncharacterized membrane protein